MNSIEIGKIGESIAARYLIKNGYLILAKNHKEKFYEIDIIARDKCGVLVFCEVKAMRGISCFIPEDNLNKNKYRKMVLAAELFLAKHKDAVSDNSGWRMDLVAVVLGEGRFCTLRHYKNI